MLTTQLIHPQLLVIDRIRELIPAAIEAYATAHKHAVTVVGTPVGRQRR